MPDRNKRFRGKPKKVKIVSNNTDFFSPEPEEEIEQKLTVSSSGDVRFSAYQFDDTILRKQHFKIEPDAADAILNAVVDYFNTADPDYIEDVGIWEVIITNANGTAYKMSGSLNDDSGTGSKSFKIHTENAWNGQSVFIRRQSKNRYC